MTIRYRIIVKLWETASRGLISRYGEPIYTSATWQDTEPTNSQLIEALNKALEGRPEDYWYGEATFEKVIHTTRTKLVLT